MWWEEIYFKEGDRERHDIRREAGGRDTECRAGGVGPANGKITWWCCNCTVIVIDTPGKK